MLLLGSKLAGHELHPPSCLSHLCNPSDMLVCLCYKSGYRQRFRIRGGFAADCDGDEVLCASLQFFPTRPGKSSQRRGRNREFHQGTRLERRKGAKGASADYEEDSHVIHASSGAGDGFFFMPFGLRRTALVISWEPGPATAPPSGFKVEWSRPVTSHRVAQISNTEIELLKFDGIEESLLLIPLGPKRNEAAGNSSILANSLGVGTDFRGKRPRSGTDGSGFQPVAGRTRAARTDEAGDYGARALARQAAAPFADEEERHLWRQSEVMLRMAQSREPNRPGRNNDGLIVASLPDGVWFTPWVRDMAYAAVALARMGHRDEARAALLAYFNAQPTGKMREQTRGADYQISVVRYFGDGSEEPFFTMEGSTNIEFDDWGLVLWVLGEYLRKYDDPTLLATPTYRGRLYESARNYIVKPLLANLDQYDHGLIVSEDTSIWEERSEGQEAFCLFDGTCCRGLEKTSLKFARREDDQAIRTDILNYITQLEQGFNAAFIRDGKLRGTLEEGVKNDIDGALLAVINFGIVTDPAVVRRHGGEDGASESCFRWLSARPQHIYRSENL